MVHQNLKRSGQDTGDHRERVDTHGAPAPVACPCHGFVTLIGYRGTGKTTLAKRLAERLALDAVDVDPLIERQAGQNIAAIFKERGEPYFRELEEKIIASIVQGPPVVLSPGGGAILREKTRERLRQAGLVLWLTASPETILMRLDGDAGTRDRRPSLTSFSAAEEIIAVLHQRTPLYRETAHERIDTEAKTPEMLVEEILPLLEKHHSRKRSR